MKGLHEDDRAARDASGFRQDSGGSFGVASMKKSSAAENVPSLKGRARSSIRPAAAPRHGCRTRRR